MVQSSDSPGVLEEYIRRFSDSVYAGFAKARLEELKRKQVVINVPKPEAVRPAEEACEDGLLVSVAVGKKPCIKPGSGDSFRDCPNCPEMVVVPAGSFRMGSTKNELESYEDYDPHAVTIARPFAVGRFAVTRDEFEAFVKDCGHRADGGCYFWSGNGWKKDSGKSWRSPGFAQTGSHPAVCVDWNDAKAYLAWLSKRTSKEYRMLSEAEFEYAARAGTATPFWWGTVITPEQANYDGSAKPYKGGRNGEYGQKTVPVKSFQPNPWGLYQVHGNVMTWTGDCWNETYDNAPSDGSALATGDCKHHVLRGGSWLSGPTDLRAAYRWVANLIPGFRLNFAGFRVARMLPRLTAAL